MLAWLNIGRKEPWAKKRKNGKRKKRNLGKKRNGRAAMRAKERTRVISMRGR